MARGDLAGDDVVRPGVACLRNALGLVTRKAPMGHIDWIKRSGLRLGGAETRAHAWFYRMPWVLVAAVVMVLLIYVIAFSGVVMFLYWRFIEAPVKRLVVRRS
jgi:hypothetical protein